MRTDRRQRGAVTPGWSTPPAAPVSELVCLICDVTWSGRSDDGCWMCGEPGRRAADVLPWSALAPGLFL